MTPSFETIVSTHLDAWNAPPGPDRDRSIRSVYSPDVFIGEPDRMHRGHGGMADAITRTSHLQSVQDLVTYSWALGPTGEAPIATGRDVLIVREGRITSLYVLIDPP